MTRITVLHTEVLRELLIAQPMTYDEMAAAVNLGKSSVQRWVRDMRAVPKIRIVGYSKDKRGRAFIPQFQWQAGPDAERPGQAKTSAERMRDVRRDECLRMLGKKTP